MFKVWFILNSGVTFYLVVSITYYLILGKKPVELKKSKTIDFTDLSLIIMGILYLLSTVMYFYTKKKKQVRFNKYDGLLILGLILFLTLSYVYFYGEEKTQKDVLRIIKEEKEVCTLNDIDCKNGGKAIGFKPDCKCECDIKNMGKYCELERRKDINGDWVCYPEFDCTEGKSDRAYYDRTNKKCVCVCKKDLEYGGDRCDEKMVKCKDSSYCNNRGIVSGYEPNCKCACNRGYIGPRCKGKTTEIYQTRCNYVNVCCINGELCGGSEISDGDCQDECEEAYKNTSLRLTGEGCDCDYEEEN